jgi:hypothetical protein
MSSKYRKIRGLKYDSDLFPHIRLTIIEINKIRYCAK